MPKAEERFTILKSVLSSPAGRKNPHSGMSPDIPKVTVGQPSVPYGPGDRKFELSISRVSTSHQLVADFEETVAQILIFCISLGPRVTWLVEDKDGSEGGESEDDSGQAVQVTLASR